MQSSRLLVLPRALRVSAPAADVGSPEHPLHTRPHSLCHSLASPALDTARTPPRPPWPTVEARTRRNARCSAPSQPKPSSSVPPPRRAAHLARAQPRWKTAGVPPPLTAAVAVDMCAWPGSHGPPLAEPWPPTGAAQCPDASPPLHRRRRGSDRPEQEAPASSSVFLATKDLGVEFDKIQGVFCRTHDSDE